MKKKIDPVVAALGVVLLAVLVVMTVALAKPREAASDSFVPPAFDENAVTGAPDVPESLGYISPYQEGMAYRFSVCGNVLMDGTAATVYLTNPAENSVWLKLRVLDAEGRTLGETGLLRPNEYVAVVELAEPLPAGTPVRLKIMGYEPETYLSAGSATLNTTIGGTE